MDSHNHGKSGSFVSEIIFGFNDGLVTILALTAGMASVISSNSIIILASLIASLGGSVSMSLGSYISTKSQREVYETQMKMEEKEIKELPETERKEIEEIYKKKGFKGKELKSIVNRITSNKRVWLDTMMRDELGLGEMLFKSPLKSAIFMFLFFIIGSIIPLSVYFFMKPSTAIIPSVLISLAGLFAAGSIKTRLTGRFWMKSGIELMLIGASAAAVGYYIGIISSVFLGVSV